MNSVESSILMEQFERLIKLDSKHFVLSAISGNVYIFHHKPTDVSFYVGSDDDSSYDVSFFQGGKTTHLNKVTQDTELFAHMSTMLAFHNLGELLDAQFKLGQYLEKVDT